MPRISAGIRSGVACTRLNCKPEHAAQQFDQQRLRDARHALHQRVAVAEHGDERLIDQLGLPGDDLADLRAAMFQQLHRGCDVRRCSRCEAAQAVRR